MIRQGEVTKREIAECARNLFECNGYSATSMEEIQEVCGHSKDMIGHYFINKEDLFLYCVKDTTVGWLKNWEEQEMQLSSVTDKLYLSQGTLFL